MRIAGRGSEYNVIHLKSSESESLITLITRELSISIERCNELNFLGAIYIDEDRAQNINQKINSGMHIRVHLEPRRFYNGPLKDRIVKTNNDFYIVDKPGGLPTQALVDNCRENLLHLLSEELDEKLFITHRLDVVTRGLILIARNSVYQSKANEFIRDRKIKRRYKALVEKNIKPDRYVHFMEPSPKAPKQIKNEASADWLRCELIVSASRLIDVDIYELDIELVTGRSQQIRAQLAALGAPIIGDTSYGSEKNVTDTLTNTKAIRLEAYELTGLP